MRKVYELGQNSTSKYAKILLTVFVRGFGFQRENINQPQSHKCLREVCKFLGGMSEFVSLTFCLHRLVKCLSSALGAESIKRYKTTQQLHLYKNVVTKSTLYQHLYIPVDSDMFFSDISPKLSLKKTLFIKLDVLNVCYFKNLFFPVHGKDSFISFFHISLFFFFFWIVQVKQNKTTHPIHKDSSTDLIYQFSGELHYKNNRALH